MYEALGSIKKCLAAGNEERAIELVKSFGASGNATDLVALQTLEPGASVKLRYYLRRAIRSLSERMVGAPLRSTPCQAPVVHAHNVVNASPVKRSASIAHKVPQAKAAPRTMSNDSVMPPLDPEIRALADRLTERVAVNPARLLTPVRSGVCPLERAELVRLALDFEDRIADCPAERLAPATVRRFDDANLEPDLSSADVDRLTKLFEEFVAERPAIRIGGFEGDSFDLATELESDILHTAFRSFSEFDGIAFAA